MLVIYRITWIILSNNSTLFWGVIFNFLINSLAEKTLDKIHIFFKLGIWKYITNITNFIKIPVLFGMSCGNMFYGTVSLGRIFPRISWDHVVWVRLRPVAFQRVTLECGGNQARSHLEDDPSQLAPPLTPCSHPCLSSFFLHFHFMNK